MNPLARGGAGSEAGSQVVIILIFTTAATTSIILTIMIIIIIIIIISISIIMIRQRGVLTLMVRRVRVELAAMGPRSKHSKYNDDDYGTNEDMGRGHLRKTGKGRNFFQVADDFDDEDD